MDLESNSNNDQNRQNVSTGISSAATQPYPSNYQVVNIDELRVSEEINGQILP